MLSLWEERALQKPCHQFQAKKKVGKVESGGSKDKKEDNDKDKGKAEVKALSYTDSHDKGVTHQGGVTIEEIAIDEYPAGQEIGYISHDIY